MTNHIASTSRWRLRAGVLGHLAGRALDHLRQAFSGFIAPALAAEAVRRSAQRTVALLPAPAPTMVEPEIVGLVEDPRSGLREAEPVAAVAAPIEVAAEDTVAASSPAKLVPAGQPAPSPHPGATKRGRRPTKTATRSEAGGAAAEPAATLSSDAPKLTGQAHDLAAIPMAVGQSQTAPASLHQVVLRRRWHGEGGHFAPQADIPPAEMRTAKPGAASPTAVDVATAGRIEKPTPVDVLAPELHPIPSRARRDVAEQALPQAGSEPAGPQTRDELKPVGRARNKTPAPQTRAAAVAVRRTGRKPRRAGEAFMADLTTDSEGSFVNSSGVAD